MPAQTTLSSQKNNFLLQFFQRRRCPPTPYVGRASAHRSSKPVTGGISDTNGGGNFRSRRMIARFRMMCDCLGRSGNTCAGGKKSPQEDCSLSARLLVQERLELHSSLPVLLIFRRRRRPAEGVAQAAAGREGMIILAGAFRKQSVGAALIVAVAVTFSGRGDVRGIMIIVGRILRVLRWA
jgi:hypothetical protein